jgi:hypothetical protein
MMAASTLIQAQPWVSSVLPVQHALNVASSAAIEVTFTEDIDATSLSDATARVSGHLTGFYSSQDIFYDELTRTATIQLLQDFKPGEIINVVLTGGIKNSGGAAMPAPFQWKFTVVSANGSGIFTQTHTVNVSSGQSPYYIVPGDFDNDEDVDLATADKGANTVSILLNDGTGMFAVSQSAPYGSSPDAITAADFDNDGDLDLAVANATMNVVTVLENDGSSSFSQSGTINVGNFPHTINSGDLDGDGDMDILVSNWSSGSMSFLENDGSSNFTNHFIASGSSGPELGLISDVENDGDPDIIIAHFSSNNLLVFGNDGAGSFSQTGNIFLGNNTHLPIEGDFNNDGWIDVVCPHYGASRVSVLLNDGAGQLVQDSLLTQTGSPWSGTACDVDSDGDLDLVITKYNAAEAALWINDGNGRFSTTATLPAGANPHVVVYGDFNGDEALDLATANEGSNTVTVFLNTPIVGINGNANQANRFFTLFENYPNPFNPTTNIGFRISDFGFVELSVFDITGEMVRILMKGEMAPGNYTYQWDGRDDSGQLVSSGIYMILLIYYNLLINI